MITVSIYGRLGGDPVERLTKNSKAMTTATVAVGAMTARAIVTALRGRWLGRYGMARCPAHKDRTPSLKVSDPPGGSDEPIFHCFAGCDWRDVKDALRRDGLLPERGQDNDRGLADRALHDREAAARRGVADRADKAERTTQALDIWRRCVPAPDTLVETYLRARGITLPVPVSIRYLPDAYHKATNLILPAMVAGVQDLDGRVVAIHRTFLSRDGTAKAGVREPKMSLGPVAGGAVRLALAGSKLAICEGIESALSFQQAAGIATWAALSVPGVRSLVLPKEISAVVLGPDGDDPGDGAAVEAAKRFVREGRKVRIARPPRGMDWNDVLREPEKEMADA